MHELLDPSEPALVACFARLFGYLEFHLDVSSKLLQQLFHLKRLKLEGVLDTELALAQVLKKSFVGQLKQILGANALVNYVYV